MFEFRILRYEPASRLASSGWPTHIVSVMNAVLPVTGEAKVCHLPMDDITRPTPGLQQPSPSHLRQVLDFTRNLTADDRLLVHCLSGVNRSTAIGIAILIQHGMSAQAAFDAIAAQRPALAPNRLLIAFIDLHFGLEGALNRLVAKAI